MSLWLLVELIVKMASVKLGSNKMRWDVFKGQSILKMFFKDHKLTARIDCKRLQVSQLLK